MKISLCLLNLAVLGTSVSASAGLMFNYSQLALKDLDQMSKIVREKVIESSKSGGSKAVPLKEGLQAVFSRPNEDGMIEKVMSPLKNGLDELDAWEPSVRQLVKEAIGALQNSKAFKPVIQVTYVVFLENLISEMKPRAQMEFESSVLKQIQNANIVLTSQAKNERVLRMMKETRSPSEIAADVLKSAAEMQKAEILPPAPEEPLKAAAPPASAAPSK